MPMHEWKCCDKCWHSPEKPCPDLVACLTEGPICHKDPACSKKIVERTSQNRRENPSRPVIFIGAGTCGLGAGAAKTLIRIKGWLSDRKVEADIVEVGCIGMCIAEPMVDVQLPGKTRVSFSHVTEDKVDSLLDRVFAGDIPSDSVLGQFRSDRLASWPGVPFLDEHPFLKLQTRWVLANCGIIAPTSIEEYIARGGYRGLAKALSSSTPQELCDLVIKSGLRGTRRRRLPHRQEMEIRARHTRRPQVLRLQCRRGRPGSVHGPRGHRRRPLPSDRGSRHQFVRHRREPRVRLHPR